MPMRINSFLRAHILGGKYYYNITKQYISIRVSKSLKQISEFFKLTHLPVESNRLHLKNIVEKIETYRSIHMRKMILHSCDCHLRFALEINLTLVLESTLSHLYRNMHDCLISRRPWFKKEIKWNFEESFAYKWSLMDPIWGVSRQLSQRAAREPYIVLFLTHVYDTKMYLKKLFNKHFRRIFSSTFQWRKQFFQNFSFSPWKSTKHVISQKVYF